MSPSQSSSIDPDTKEKVAKEFHWSLPEGFLECRK